MLILTGWDWPSSSILVVVVYSYEVSEWRATRLQVSLVLIVMGKLVVVFGCMVSTCWVLSADVHTLRIMIVSLQAES